MKRKLLVAVLCMLAVFGCAAFSAYAIEASGNAEKVGGGCSQSRLREV